MTGLLGRCHVLFSQTNTVWPWAPLVLRHGACRCWLSGGEVAEERLGDDAPIAWASLKSDLVLTAPPHEFDDWVVVVPGG